MLVAPGGVRTNYLETSLSNSSRHPAYDIPTGGFNQLIGYIKGVDQSTWCTPENCGQVLFDVVTGQDQRTLPTRLLMGVDALQATKGLTEGALKEIEEWKDVTIKCSPSRA